MHDGAHGSFSKNKWVNKMAAISVNFLGADNFMWRTKHNVIHHAYTNIDGVDDDIDARPFLRLSPEQKFYGIYKFQHWYFWMAYSLLYIWWIFVTDYKKYFMKRIGPVALQKMKWYHHISFWGFKLVHAFLFIALPVWQVGFVAWLVGFLIFALFAGFVLSIVFQLAHTVEHTHFPVPDASTGKMEDEWAIHQLKTTANFATKNKLVSWFVGGLNFQIEHHLFPKISHIHYPAISKIIKQACLEYGITYIEYARVRYAVASHISFLRQMGKG
jgi:linoleoyl-CoA desaturase